VVLAQLGPIQYSRQQAHASRYEDVQELLAAKIDVVSTLNIQHIESIAPVVHSITGITSCAMTVEL